MRFVASIGRPLTAVLLGVLGCGATAPSTGGQPLLPPPQGAFGPQAETPIGHIEIRKHPQKPTLALVTREGDPMPALSATFAVNTPQSVTAALSAVVEVRLKAAGLDVDTHVDRASFRVRMLVPSRERHALFFSALLDALIRPVVPSSAETVLAAERADALKRNALDDRSLAEVAECALELGAVPGEVFIDPRSAAGAAELEAYRASALHLGRMAIGAVGPNEFCLQTAALLEGMGQWPNGPAAPATWPQANTNSVYRTAELGRGQARLISSVRVGNPLSAAAAAERLGAADSPLSARLSALGDPFRIAEVSGIARTHGGCVKVVLESDGAAPATMDKNAAAAAALLYQELQQELSEPGDQHVAARQILKAADPRECAARASWWALSGSVAAVADRYTTVLALPVGDAGTSGSSFSGDLERLLTSSRSAVPEARQRVERGQGELWVLLAGLCGADEEGSHDAGLTALATLSVTQARRAGSDVTLEPWITADGIGILAHAPFRDETESKRALAIRVANAAARTLLGTPLSSEALSSARASQLGFLEQSTGHHGIAFESLLGALSPDRPSALLPFGLWNRVAQSSMDLVALRFQAFAAEPLRIAVLANADAEQAQIAVQAAQRWMAPSRDIRMCKPPLLSSAKPGRIDLRLPKEAVLGQALLGAPMPAAGKPGYDLAYFTALALDGRGGLLETALGASRFAAHATARMVGGAENAALVIDVRAPSDSLSEAIDQVKALLKELAQNGLSAQAMARAAALSVEASLKARSEPRLRIAELWTGRSTVPESLAQAAPPQPMLKEFLGRVLREESLVVVDARPTTGP